MVQTPNARFRVLVTGAAGGIGRRILPDLAGDYDLRLTDIRAGMSDAGPIEPLDITDYQQTLHAMRGIDMVVHMAIASIRSMQDWSTSEQDDEVMRVNVMGTQHVLEAARVAGVRRVVFASSLTTVLGQSHQDAAGAATFACPVNLYACTKLFGEHLAELYAREYDLPVICLRFGQPYPMPKFGDAQLKEPGIRAIMVTFEDLAYSIRCGLREDGPRFAVATVLSNSDVCTFQCAGADAIGYRPLMCLTASGQSPTDAALMMKR